MQTNAEQPYYVNHFFSFHINFEHGSLPTLSYSLPVKICHHPNYGIKIPHGWKICNWRKIAEHHKVTFITL